jgi:hypothetical protein
LFGNPLAEEPDYRLKIIYMMPQIKTLDRHVVTVAERIKAKRICENEYGLNQGAKKAAVVRDKGPIISKKVGNGFSTGEKDLYRAMETLEKRKEQEEIEAQERTRKFFETKTY